MAVETIRAEINLGKINNTKIIWETLINFSEYPKFIDEVIEIKVSDRDNSSGKSEWDISLDGAPIHWVESDRLDAENLSLKFEILDGDFDEFQGQWKILEKENGVLLSLKLEYQMAIPVIEVALGSVLKEKFQEYATALVTKLSDKIKGYGEELLEESSPTYSINDKRKTDKISIYEVKEAQKKSSGAA